MADPELTRGADDFKTSESTTFTFYNGEESIQKSANLIPLPLPASDSDETIAFDLLGVTREFTIKGLFTTNDNADLWKFAADLDSLIDGNQGNTGADQVGYTYSPKCLNDGNTPRSPTVTVIVYVNDVSYDYVRGEPNSLSYSVTLMEVSSSSA